MLAQFPVSVQISSIHERSYSCGKVVRGNTFKGTLKTGYIEKCVDRLKLTMKPLATNQKVLTWLCILPIYEETSKWKKPFYIVFCILFFTIEVIALTASASFFLLNVTTNLTASIYALCQTVGSISVIYMYSAAFLLRHKIAAFLQDLQKIYDASAV